MYNAIKKFLALHHHLSLPGIGNFSIETKPAGIDFANRSITPTQSKIVFSNEKLPAEKKFYAFLSQQLKIDELQAIRSFTNFTSRLQNDLNEKNQVYFKGIGTLTRQTAHVFLFQPEEIPEYFPPIGAERVIRKNTTHTVRVGEEEKTSEEMQTALHQPKKIKEEKWWLTAAILAFIGIAAITFYYIIHR
jgi:nucleoid DNA-binding protein